MQWTIAWKHHKLLQKEAIIKEIYSIIIFIFKTNLCMYTQNASNIGYFWISSCWSFLALSIPLWITDKFRYIDWNFKLLEKIIIDDVINSKFIFMYIYYSALHWPRFIIMTELNLTWTVLLTLYLNLKCSRSYFLHIWIYFFTMQ